jgi:hypothetical protein
MKAFFIVTGFILLMTGWLCWEALKLLLSIPIMACKLIEAKITRLINEVIP